MESLKKTLEDISPKTEGKNATVYEDFMRLLMKRVCDSVIELIDYKKSCMYKLNEDYDEYDPNECNEYHEKKKANYQCEADIEKIKEIFGDWEEED